MEVPWLLNWNGGFRGLTSFPAWDELAEPSNSVAAISKVRFIVVSPIEAGPYHASRSRSRLRHGALRAWPPLFSAAVNGAGAPCHACHETVKHTASEYARGDVHVNTAEGYLSV